MIIWLAVLLAVAMTLVVVGGITWLWSTMSRMKDELHRMELELAKARHTRSTWAGLMDATADNNEVSWLLQEALIRLEAQHRRLGTIKQGPHEYDAEQKSVKGDK